MILSDYKARLQAANIMYVPLAAPHFGDFSEDLIAIDEDLTGATLQAELRDYPDQSGTAVLAMTAAFVGMETKTWDELVEEGFLTSVPAGEDGATSLSVSTVRLTIDHTDMASLPVSPVITGGGVTLFWDLRVTTTGNEVLIIAAGDFKIVQGVSQ